MTFNEIFSHVRETVSENNSKTFRSSITIPHNQKSLILKEIKKNNWQVLSAAKIYMHDIYTTITNNNRDKCPTKYQV